MTTAKSNVKQLFTHEFKSQRTNLLVFDFNNCKLSIPTDDTGNFILVFYFV